MSEIQSKVVEIIVDKLGVKESEVVREASFTAHLGADSFPDGDAEKIQTVGDAVDYIESHK